MGLILLNCNHCGNVIETTRNTKFLTCLFCDSQLEVIRTSDSIYTKVRLEHELIEPKQNNALIHRQELLPLDDTVSNTSNKSIAQQYTLIQKEIDDLDIAWNQELQQHTILGLSLNASDTENVWFPFMTAILGGILALYGMKVNSTLVSIGSFLMVLAVVIAAFISIKKQQYLDAKVLYENKREQLIKQLPTTPLIS